MPVWIIQTAFIVLILLKDNISFVFSSDIQWESFHTHL